MPASSTIVYPVYYRLVVRRDNTWYFTKGDMFVNLFNAPWLQQEDLFSAFDTSMKKVANELRRINDGKQGYYIADILDKKYYYCGTELESVKIKLKELGIGRDEPFVDG